MNDQTLHAIVQHAYAHSPEVRERFDRAGLSPDDIRTVAGLARVPVLTKDEAIARQQADPPFGGMLAAPLSAVSHLFFSPELLELAQKVPIIFFLTSFYYNLSLVSLVL